VTHPATRLGILTPSSNTVLEPMTTAMLAGLPDVSAHFSRFAVTEIALTASSLGQFDDSAILRAAELLAHAKVDAIGWSGTSASWLGFEADRRLCARIAAATGIPATTSILALNEILERLGARSLGLVTPYAEAVQARIAANYAAAGIACPAERHCGITENFAFATVPEAEVAALIRAVAAARPDAVAIVCTNMRGGRVAPAIEAETGVPVLDSVATVLWKLLAIAGADPARVQGWGRLFSLPAAPPARS
jgi:maleate isomerase